MVAKEKASMAKIIRAKAMVKVNWQKGTTNNTDILVKALEKDLTS